MQIDSINPLETLTSFQSNPRSKLTSSNDQAAIQSNDSITISNAVQTMDEKVNSIMKNHDLNNISYNSLEKMGSELRDAGIISDYEFLIVLAPPNIAIPGFEAKGLEGTGQRWLSNEPNNITTDFEKDLKRAQERDPHNPSIKVLQERVDMVNYLNTFDLKFNIDKLNV